jgi:long-chain acyl-CoA synthetase
MGTAISSKPEVSSQNLPLECLYRWEKERGDRVYLTQPIGGETREWTWAQAAGEVRHMAGWLKAQNWDAGTRVAILSKNCAWWIMSDLAIWMAGYVSVPIYPSLTAQSARAILEHSEAKALFLGATDEKEATKLGIPDGVTCIRFPTAPPGDAPSWDELIADVPPLAGSPVRPPDELATIIYTSGTMGTPKGVMHSFAAFSFFTAAVARLLNLTAEDRLLSYLPLAHIVERCAIEALGLFLGFHIYFCESLDTFLVDIGRARPTLFQSVPRLLLKFQQGVYQKIPKARLDALLRIPLLNRYLKKKILHQLGLGAARYAVSGAAPLAPDLLRWYRSLGLELGEGYGMTEILVTHVPTPGTVRAGYVGKAMEGVEAKLGENAELLVKSPMNMLGYFKDPHGTRESFTPDGYFRTGDIAFIDMDGQLKIIGRLKEQFKTSKGKYVAPAPIEARLAEHPDVEACCLIGAGRPSPIAIVLLSDAARGRSKDPADRQALERSLRRRLEEVNAKLDPHERVAFIAIIDGPWSVSNGMITPTLKIRRATVEGHYEPMIDGWKAQERPVVWESIGK